jgi:hypothetical protein
MEAHIAVTSLPKARARPTGSHVDSPRLTTSIEDDDVLSSAYALVAASHHRQASLKSCVAKWRSRRGVQLRLHHYDLAGQAAGQFRALQMLHGCLRSWKSRCGASQRHRALVATHQARRSALHATRVLREWRLITTQLAARRRHRAIVLRSDAGPSQLARLYVRSVAPLAARFFASWHRCTARKLCLRFLELRRTRLHVRDRISAWCRWAACRRMKRWHQALCVAKLSFSTQLLRMTTIFHRWLLAVGSRQASRLSALHHLERTAVGEVLPALRQRCALRRWRCELNVRAMARGRNRDTILRVMTAWRAIGNMQVRRRRLAAVLACERKRDLQRAYFEKWSEFRIDTACARRATLHFEGRLQRKLWTGWTEVHRRTKFQLALMTVSDSVLDELEHAAAGPLLVTRLGVVVPAAIPPPTKRALDALLHLDLTATATSPAPVPETPQRSAVRVTASTPEQPATARGVAYQAVGSTTFSEPLRKAVMESEAAWTFSHTDAAAGSGIERGWAPGLASDERRRRLAARPLPEPQCTEPSQQLHPNKSIRERYDAAAQRSCLHLRSARHDDDAPHPDGTSHSRGACAERSADPLLDSGYNNNRRPRSDPKPRENRQFRGTHANGDDDDGVEGSSHASRPHHHDQQQQQQQQQLLLLQQTLEALVAQARALHESISLLCGGRSLEDFLAHVPFSEWALPAAADRLAARLEAISQRQAQLRACKQHLAALRPHIAAAVVVQEPSHPSWSAAPAQFPTPSWLRPPVMMFA